MANKAIGRTAMTGVLLGVFALGYVCGTVHTPRASAQLPGGLPGGLSAPGTGPLGAATQLASSITEMEQHVSGLQKNLDTLKKIQSGLTGK